MAQWMEAGVVEFDLRPVGIHSGLGTAPRPSGSASRCANSLCEFVEPEGSLSASPFQQVNKKGPAWGPFLFTWRRGRDSNPRYTFRAYDGLANRCLQPLGHLSGELARRQAGAAGPERIAERLGGIAGDRKGIAAEAAPTSRSYYEGLRVAWAVCSSQMRS